MTKTQKMLNEALETIENLSKEEFREELIKAGYKPEDKIKDLSLEDKVIVAIINSGYRTLGSWDIANIIWDNCMRSPKPGNGIKIAHVRRVSENSNKLTYIPESHGFSVSISK